MDVADDEQEASAGVKSKASSNGERSREPSWAEKEIEAQSRASSGMGSSRGSQSK